MVASDECDADVYFGAPPASMLEVQVENVVAIHSCSKRSGMTGYRSGFLAGDPDVVASLRALRSHPGVASAEFVAGAAAAAWSDDAHPAERRFLLEPDDVDPAVLAETLLFWISYPHNPTGAVAPRDYLARVGAAARRYGFAVVSDECYADIYFGEPPASMLEVQVENVVAIHSCSKRSGMTGYRSGFLAGDPDLVAVLRRLRSHPGVASPAFVSAAAAAAWADDAHAAERRAIFREKRDRFLRFFADHGLHADASEATLYLWVRVPAGQTSASYARALLEEGIVVAPGTAFGAGEGYVRVALVPTLDACDAAGDDADARLLQVLLERDLVARLERAEVLRLHPGDGEEEVHRLHQPGVHPPLAVHLLRDAQLAAVERVERLHHRRLVERIRELRPVRERRLDPLPHVLEVRHVLTLAQARTASSHSARVGTSATRMYPSPAPKAVPGATTIPSSSSRRA